MEPMNTVSEILNKLKAEGYTVDFNLEDTCLACHGNSLKIHPDEFSVDKHYRFEGESDPADEAVVYAISSKKHNMKGTLVNGYGISSNQTSSDMVKALNNNTTTKKQGTTKEVKSNVATAQRPEGGRPLDAPLITMNLPAIQQQIKQEENWKNSDRNAITLLKTDGMRIVLIALRKGAEMKKHLAPGPISVQVISGHITFGTDLQTEELTEGKMLSLYAQVPHYLIAREESVFLLTIATPEIEK